MAQEGEYPRTNDAALYAYEWDNEAGAYVVYLDYLCNGARIARERLGRVEYDGSAVVERPVVDAPDALKPTHPVMYSLIHAAAVSSTATVSHAKTLRFDHEK